MITPRMVVDPKSNGLMERPALFGSPPIWNITSSVSLSVALCDHIPEVVADANACG
ncbi:MAG: hypothetical protein ABJK59_04965 [Erythrobacter sp.]|uniref:hypothetical protein n=1 Tax=Erythrobacter sp. TaxID=1042 RepID=UPI003297FD7E